MWSKLGPDKIYSFLHAHAFAASVLYLLLSLWSQLGVLGKDVLPCTRIDVEHRGEGDTHMKTHGERVFFINLCRCRRGPRQRPMCSPWSSATTPRPRNRGFAVRKRRGCDTHRTCFTPMSTRPFRRERQDCLPTITITMANAGATGSPTCRVTGRQCPASSLQIVRTLARSDGCCSQTTTRSSLCRGCYIIYDWQTTLSRSTLGRTSPVAMAAAPRAHAAATGKSRACYRCQHAREVVEAKMRRRIAQ